MYLRGMVFESRDVGAEYAGGFACRMRTRYSLAWGKRSQMSLDLIYYLVCSGILEGAPVSG